MAFDFTLLAGVFQLLVALGKDVSMAAGETIGWGDVAQRAMEASLVVMVDEGACHSPGILQAQGRLRADGLLLERAMKAFDLAVALRIVR